MAKTLTVDAARRTLAKAEAARNTSIIRVCTADQMMEIEQRIKWALDHGEGLRKDFMPEQGRSHP